MLQLLALRVDSRDKPEDDGLQLGRAATIFQCFARGDGHPVFCVGGKGRSSAFTAGSLGYWIPAFAGMKQREWLVFNLQIMCPVLTTPLGP